MASALVNSLNSLNTNVRQGKGTSRTTFHIQAVALRNAIQATIINQPVVATQQTEIRNTNRPLLKSKTRALGETLRTRKTTIRDLKALYGIL